MRTNSRKAIMARSREIGLEWNIKNLTSYGLEHAPLSPYWQRFIAAFQRAIERLAERLRESAASFIEISRRTVILADKGYQSKPLPAHPVSSPGARACRPGR